MLYYGIFLLLFVLALLEQIDDRQEISGKLMKKTLYFFIAVVITIFVGLREDIGFDYDSYKHIYNSYPITQWEPGFNLIVNISNEIFGLNYNSFLLLFATISIMLKALFFLKYFKYPTLLFCFSFPLMINTDFGLIRQGLSLSVILWTLPAIKDRNPIKFIIVWLIAVSFHNSALIFFPIYFFNRITITHKNFFPLFFIGFIFNAVQGGTFIFLLFTKIFLGTHVGNIMNSMIRAYGITNNPIFYLIKPSSIICIIVLCLYMFTIYNRGIRKKESGFEFTAFNIYFILFLLIRMFDSISKLSERGGKFLEILEIIIMYYIIEFQEKREIKLIFYIFIILYGLLQIRGSLMYPTFDLRSNEFGRYHMFSEFFGL